MADGEKTSSLEKLVPVLLVATMVLAFVVGVLWQKVSNMGGGSFKAIPSPTPAQEETPGVVNEDTGELSDEYAQKVARVVGADIAGATDSTPVIDDEEHLNGLKNADYFFIEYSDLECPYCAQFHPTIEKLIEKHEGKITWVYRHLPLSFHPNAKPAATASECVNEIGGNKAFWDFLNGVFEDQENSLSKEGLEAVAAGLGIDQAEYNACIDSGDYDAKVKNQYDSGVAAGVSGTPTSFLMSKEGKVWIISGASDYEALESLVNDILNPGP